MKSSSVKMMDNKAKWNQAVFYILQALEDPDPEMREHAHKREFYNEFIWVRRALIEHLHTLWH